MSKNRFKEEKEFEEITSINNSLQINKIKEDINKYLTSDIKIIAKNESQKKLITSIKNNEITICAGPAGCGKTFVSIAYALSLLRKNTNRFKKIYLVKSVTTLKGEELGFLKGDLKEKIEPFMWSFYINLEKVVQDLTIKSLIEKFGSLDNLKIVGPGFRDFDEKNPKKMITQAYQIDKVPGQMHDTKSKKVIQIPIEKQEMMETFATSLRKAVHRFSRIIQIDIYLDTEITPLTCIEIINTDKDYEKEQFNKVYDANVIAEKIIEVIPEGAVVAMEGFSYGSKGNSFIDLIFTAAIIRHKIFMLSEKGIIQKMSNC